MKQLTIGLVVAVITIFAIPMKTFAIGEKWQYCADLVDAIDFVAPTFEPKYKLHRSKSTCSTKICFIEKAPCSKNRLHIYFSKKVAPFVTWGNFGWACKNVAVVRSSNSARIKVNRRFRNQVNNALALAMGIELETLLGDQSELQGDIEDHNSWAFEMNCLRDVGGKVASFNEIARLPRGLLIDMLGTRGFTS